MSNLVVSECLPKKIKGGKPILKLLVLNNYSVKILIESVSIILNTESFKNINLSISSTVGTKDSAPVDYCRKHEFTG